MPGLHIVGIGWSFLDEKVILKGDSFFYASHFTRDRAGSFSQKFRRKKSRARNRLRAGALPGIFKYSTEHLDLSDHCKYLPVSSLRIKKSAIIFAGIKSILQRNYLNTQEEVHFYHLYLVNTRG